ncbi:MAG TPA: BolA family protein [Methylocystis sp.]|nr:BolA family protein [Methylocystis sp.]HXZ14585.1 BolA family protein [Roseiarcus sp.]
MTQASKGAVKAKIEAKMRAAFAPAQLQVLDESHRHAGHAGHHLDGETHFHIEIVSDAFAGKSRLERHRLINAALAEELSGRVHALSLSARACDEAS